jgi:hypothetical protein
MPPGCDGSHCNAIVPPQQLNKPHEGIPLGGVCIRNGTCTPLFFVPNSQNTCSESLAFIHITGVIVTTMALDNEYEGTAELDPRTAPSTGNQPPNQAEPAPASTARTNPAPDVEKELQRLRSEQGRIAAAARRAEEAANQLRQQNRTLQMRDMSDVERLQFERDEAYQYAQQTQAQLQEAEAARQREEARMADLAEIAEEEGIPMSVLQDAQSPKEARRLAIQYIKSNLSSNREAEAERSEANRPYLGSGAPTTPTSRKEQRFEQHTRNRDSRAYILEILNGD